jgi:hypothetical protein
MSQLLKFYHGMDFSSHALQMRGNGGVYVIHLLKKTLATQLPIMYTYKQGITKTLKFVK